MGNSDAEAIVATLQGVVDASGRLLHVEREPAAGAAGAHGSLRLRLTFDVGVVTLQAGRGDGLRANSELDPPRGLLPAGEEEPWWRLVGHPLCRARAHPDGTLFVQFRADDDKPVRLVLGVVGGVVSARALS